MKYNKLVRDKIPEYIKSKGQAVSYHIANEEEYWEKLKEKLSEEMEEFCVDESIEEFADILEVIDAIAEYKGFSREEVKRVREEKVEQRGKFSERVISDVEPDRPG